MAGRILKRLVQNLYLLPQSAIRGEVNGMPGAGCAAEPSFLREPAAAKAWGRNPASAHGTGRGRVGADLLQHEARPAAPDDLVEACRLQQLTTEATEFHRECADAASVKLRALRGQI